MPQGISVNGSATTGLTTTIGGHADTITRVPPAMETAMAVAAQNPGNGMARDRRGGRDAIMAIVTGGGGNAHLERISRPG